MTGERRTMQKALFYGFSPMAAGLKAPDFLNASLGPPLSAREIRVGGEAVVALA